MPVKTSCVSDPRFQSWTHPTDPREYISLNMTVLNTTNLRVYEVYAPITQHSTCRQLQGNVMPLVEGSHQTLGSNHGKFSTGLLLQSPAEQGSHLHV